MEVKLPSFFVLFLPSHVLDNEFIFVYIVNIKFICDGEIYLLTYLLNDTIYNHFHSSI